MKKIVFILSFIGFFLSAIVVFAEMPPPPPNDDNVVDTPSSTATLMRATNQSKVYEIKNGKRHWIPTAGVFNDYGFKWSEIQIVSESTLNAYPRAKTLRAIGSQTVYYLTESGMTRGMPSSEVFLSYGNKWEDVFEISAKELNAYEHNNLIRAEGDFKVYLIEGGKKRWIESVKDFNDRKLNWSKIAPVNQTELNSYPNTNTNNANTNTTVSILDCQQDLQCLIQASINCRPAKVIYTTTTDVFGIKHTNTSFFEIKGSETDKCNFYLRTEKIDLTFPASVSQEIVNQQKILYQKLEGQDGTCKFKASDLTDVLTRWSKGTFSTGNVHCTLGATGNVCTTEGGDFGVAECQGTYFSSSITENSQTQATNYATTMLAIIPLGTSTNSTVDMGNFYTLRTAYLLNAQDSNRNFVTEFYPSTKLILKYT
ncbi:MAG: hypothetical protein WC242_03450 [Candidatus Paceibacterota bacterium]|jgi:hypothetical protein